MTLDLYGGGWVAGRPTVIKIPDYSGKFVRPKIL
jgi:hypothetical protein